MSDKVNSFVQWMLLTLLVVLFAGLASYRYVSEIHSYNVSLEEETQIEEGVLKDGILPSEGDTKAKEEKKYVTLTLSWSPRDTDNSRIFIHGISTEWESWDRDAWPSPPEGFGLSAILLCYGESTEDPILSRIKSLIFSKETQEFSVSLDVRTQKWNKIAYCQIDLLGYCSMDKIITATPNQGCDCGCTVWFSNATHVGDIARSILKTVDIKDKVPVSLVRGDLYLTIDDEPKIEFDLGFSLDQVYWFYHKPKNL